MRSVLVSLLVLVIVGGSPARAASQEKMNRDARQTPTLDALEAEARAIKNTRPEQWVKWTEAADEFYEAFAKKTFPWRNRGAPPLPDFKSLDFPLAFLAEQLRRLQGADERDAHFRFRGYLEAVIEHPDPRRARFLEEYGELHWGNIQRDNSGLDRMLARAADAGWATEKLRERLVGNLILYEYYLPYMLLERFAAELPPDVVAAGYGYVYAQGQQGGIYIINDGGVEHWKLLWRLDRERALSDIVALHEKKPPDAALLSLLIKRTVAPDARLAEAAEGWLSDVYRPGGQFKNVGLHALRLKSSPDEHLPTVVGRLHKLVGVSPRYYFDEPARPDEVETLLAAMVEIEPSHITNAHTRAMHESALVMYANRRAIAADARLGILDWMARQRHPELPKVLARWLVEERDADARDEARWRAQTKWGDYGRESLKQAEQLNAGKKPKP
ncbi:MAG TPA: hypothetical protein VFX96_01195 [Pyrinomonadaceae bacterium]|nr:hypothetical protein [Pyrinomonadaceae bacterium]